LLFSNIPLSASGCVVVVVGGGGGGRMIFSP
jgi:hypothetical protein